MYNFKTFNNKKKYIQAPQPIASILKEFNQGKSAEKINREHGVRNAHNIEFKYIQPGKPTQNTYVEWFNTTYRTCILDAYWFDTIDEVRELTQVWVHDYNTTGPHDAPGGM
ncbi:MAG: transposase [Sphingobacteriales bacterium]|nr:integrase core domain-containing protein [Hydrotalea flava]RTL48269.1 MAG: transposase [Sphingobacteriales bacterium]